MKCVKCNGTLRSVTVGDVEVDQCDKCSGIWFDLGELEKVLSEPAIATLKASVDESRTTDALRAACPACGGEGKMVQCASLRKRGLHVDSCSVCYGQWLDGGELAKLKQKGLFETVSGFFAKFL